MKKIYKAPEIRMYKFHPMNSYMIDTSVQEGIDVDHSDKIKDFEEDWNLDVDFGNYFFDDWSE